MTDSLCPILDQYLELVDDTESPLIFHRWSMIAALSAIINRRAKLSFSIGDIYPNQYVILLGIPASRKSTAIDIIAKIVSQSGFSKIASGATTPEQFLEDMHTGFDILKFKDREETDDLNLDSSFMQQGEKLDDVFICEGELLSFLGHNNNVFQTTLTKLWDNVDNYPIRKRSGDKLKLYKPTITMLGATTHENFKKMFPFDIVGQGLLSRFVLVYASGARKKEFDPKPFDKDLLAQIVEYLSILRTYEFPEQFKFNKLAYDYSKFLYESAAEEVSDPRFQYYNGRRDTHYKKLCVLIAAVNLHTEIQEGDCLLANTILSYTEKFMPLALGEFGVDKSAESTEIVYNIIRKHPQGILMEDLLKKAMSIINNVHELIQHVMKLQAANRIDKINRKGSMYFIAIVRTVDTSSNLVDYKLLAEFRENPTFDVEMTYDTSKIEAEYQLAKEFKDIMESAGMIKKPGRPKGSKNKEVELDLNTVTTAKTAGVSWDE